MFSIGSVHIWNAIGNPGYIIFKEQIIVFITAKMAIKIFKPLVSFDKNIRIRASQWKPEAQVFQCEKLDFLMTKG